MELPDKAVNFLKRQSFVIVSTIDSEGRIHSSCKGIVGINEKGKVFIVDLYHNRTYRNLKNDSRISITQIDERRFTGYTLSGQAKIVLREDIHSDYIKEWENKVLKRISDRIIKSVQDGKSSASHYEAELPEYPQYLIEIEVEKITDISHPCRGEEEK